MGLSRSGPAGSAIACEGSTTGFYTDDYPDLSHKDPELIRKANICGAKVFATDWYLVDLCRAKYDVDQGRCFARCGATLYDRSPS